MTSRRTQTALIVALSLAALQAGLWVWRGRLLVVRAVPAASRSVFLSGRRDYVRRGGSGSAAPFHLNLVVADTLESQLGRTGLARLEDALRGLDITVYTATSAPAGFFATPEQCSDCMILRYKERYSNPLFAKFQLSTWCGGRCGAGYDCYAVFILGRWCCVRTRATWVS
jgi:hypothetical protein